MFRLGVFGIFPNGLYGSKLLNRFVLEQVE